MTEGIYGIDDAGRVTFMNSKAEELLGFEPGALVGCDIHEAIHHSHPDGRPYPAAECQVISGMLSGAPTVPMAETFWRADGTPLSVEARCSPLLSDGAVVGGVVVFQDLSESVHRAAEAEAAVAELARQSQATAASRAAMLELQAAMHPATPDVPGAELGVYYLAADAVGPTGGDLYDWVRLGDGSLHLSVVDVLGKGVAATKDALAVSHALRLLALSGTPLGSMVFQADELLSPAFPDLVATAMVARYFPATGEVAVVSGGHPPALVCSAEGDVTWIEPSGRAIGWPSAGSDQVARLVLPPGALLLFYTDGLVESRRDILEGMSALGELVSSLRELPAPELARSLVERVTGSATRVDDTLALVLRRVA